MKHVTYQSRRWIVSRDRPQGIELVSLDTGELVTLKPEQRAELSNEKLVYLDAIPNLIHFPARPVSFLSELRARREAYLKEARLRKRRKVEKSPARPGEKKVRVKKVSPSLNAALAHLPPEIREMMLRGKK